MKVIYSSILYSSSGIHSYYVACFFLGRGGGGIAPAFPIYLYYDTSPGTMAHVRVLDRTLYGGMQPPRFLLLDARSRLVVLAA